MISVIKDAFPNIDNCLKSIKDKHSYVFEDNELKKRCFCF